MLRFAELSHEVNAMKKLLLLTLALGLFWFSPSQVRAQDQPTQEPSAEELEKEKAERTSKAYRLLDQVVDEAQSLRLPENRVRVQIIAGDLLWDQNQGRARTLFSLAADGVVEMGRQQAAAASQRSGEEGIGPGRGGAPRNARVFQLRQELILAVARHDATLAYQLLASTKPPAAVQNVVNQRRPQGMLNAEDNLEQALLSRIASLDPKLAAQNAELMIDKGQFPRTLPEVINQLHRQDPEAAAKLADKAVKKIQTTNLLTSTDALSLSQNLLMFGPRQPASGNTEAVALAQLRSRGPTLDQAAYIELLSSVVEAALKVTPAPNNRAQGNSRRVVTPGGQQPPTEAQIEQANARRLLSALLPALSLVDQYLPAKSSLVRQKLTEAGLPSSPTAVQFPTLREDPTVDALVQAAAQAPQQVQARLYQRAAYKALEEGNPDRARQIATDHLSEKARESVMQRVDLLEVSKKAEGVRFNEIRQKIARLQTDREKVDLLIQAAGDVQKSSPKVALQFLDEARQLTNRRATNYDHFEQQLRVAHAYATVDPSRSFEVLDPGIVQLNELLAAASVLSGFEVNTFRDGEMTLVEGGGLSSYVNRFGREIAVLARSDFERADTLAGRFQFLEPRIMTRLSIVQGLLAETTSGAQRTTATTTRTVSRPN
jgi:hypothetical protein